MLAKRVEELPPGDNWIFEPKWDGFRALVFRDGDETFIQSRDEKPLNRYFPELVDPLLSALPSQCVLDGEIVIARNNGLDFDQLQLRLHPAASRVRRAKPRPWPSPAGGSRPCRTQSCARIPCNIPVGGVGPRNSSERRPARRSPARRC